MLKDEITYILDIDISYLEGQRDRIFFLSNRSVKPPLSSGGYKLHSQSEY